MQSPSRSRSRFFSPKKTQNSSEDKQDKFKQKTLNFFYKKNDLGEQINENHVQINASNQKTENLDSNFYNSLHQYKNNAIDSDEEFLNESTPQNPIRSISRIPEIQRNTNFIEKNNTNKTQSNYFNEIGSDKEDVMIDEEQIQSRSDLKRKRNNSPTLINRNDKNDKRRKVSSSSSVVNSNSNPSNPSIQSIDDILSQTVTSQSDESLVLNSRSRQFFQEKKNLKEKDDERFPFLDPERRRDANGRRPDDENYDPTTLYISPSDLDALTSMTKQYWEIKMKKMDTILFFKKGKFYEMYEEDADIGHREFDLKISPRINMRMVGVPEASKEAWIKRFLQRGYKVGIVEQTETRNAANQRKKTDIVMRQLTEIISPGTIVDKEMLDSDETKYLLVIKENTMDKSYGIVFADLSRAEVTLGYFEDDAHRTLFDTLIHQINPVEILIEKGKISQRTETILKNINPPPSIEKISSQFFSAEDTRQTIEIERIFENEDNRNEIDVWPKVLRDFSNNDDVMAAFGIFIRHLKIYMKLEETVQLRNFKKYDPKSESQNMMLFGETLLNLEILKNRIEGSTRGTLLEHISHCVTPFGKRLFKKWILHPLRSVKAIEERLNAIDDLEKLQWDNSDANKFKGIPDIERNLRTIYAFSISEHSVVTFDESADKKRSTMFYETLCSLENLWKLAKELEKRKDEKIQSNLIKTISTISKTNSNKYPILDNSSFPDIGSLILKYKNSFNNKIFEEKQILYPIENGGYKKFDEICEKIRDLYKQTDELLLNFQKYFKSKDVKLNTPRSGTFSLLVEVPRAVEEKIGKVPNTFKYDRDTKVVKRYKDSQLDIIVEKIITAEEEKDKIVTQFLRDTFRDFSTHFPIWNHCVSTMAVLDCIHSLWTTSKFPSHSRPEFIEASQPEFIAEGLFHPCVFIDSGKEYIPNDVHLGGELPSTVILTGPNMGGKSSLLRCICVAAIMAQIGCYVPASRLRLTSIDSIFTRIGANDRICAGESTFMVELLETSNILKHSTKHSLVILDELGRGTSTIDGYSIAYAVAKHLAEEIKCLTMFSTHYHSLTDEVKNNKLYSLQCMDSIVKEINGVPHVDFLYKLKEGICSDSYGLNVARMARIPDEILKNAQSITHELKMENLEEKMLSLYDQIIQHKNDIPALKQLQKNAIQIFY